MKQPVIMMKHPLNSKWTLWFYKNESRNWEENQRQVSLKNIKLKKQIQLYARYCKKSKMLTKPFDSQKHKTQTPSPHFYFLICLLLPICKRPAGSHLWHSRRLLGSDELHLPGEQYPRRHRLQSLQGGKNFAPLFKECLKTNTFTSSDWKREIFAERYFPWLGGRKECAWRSLDGKSLQLFLKEKKSSWISIQIFVWFLSNFWLEQVNVDKHQRDKFLHHYWQVWTSCNENHDIYDDNDQKMMIVILIMMRILTRK